MPTPPLRAFLEGLAVEFASFILGGLLSWLIAVRWFDRGKFHGRWSATIRWDHQWGVKLLGKPCTDPYSTGEICLSYGAGGGGAEYWGLSVWRLCDGDQCLSELCVELKEILVRRSLLSLESPWILSHHLERLALSARIRKKLVEFDYPNFAQYTVVFRASSTTRLEADVVVREGSVSRKVGVLTADRVS